MIGPKSNQHVRSNMVARCSSLGEFPVSPLRFRRRDRGWRPWPNAADPADTRKIGFAGKKTADQTLGWPSTTAHIWSNRPKFVRIRSGFSRNRPRVGSEFSRSEFGPNSAGVGPNLVEVPVQIWPKLVEIGASSHECGPKSAEIGQMLASSG